MPRPDVSEERRDQILAAAMATFARLGFHPARMEDIARECGLAKGTLYLYFKSKDDIVAAILRRLFDRELGEVEALLTAADQAASERLLRVVRQATADVQRLTDLLPIWFEFYAVAARQEEVRQFLRDYFAGYRGRLTELIRQGIARGEYRAVDADAAATAIVALFEGLALLWGVDPQSARVDDAGELAIRLLLDGLRAPTR